jgi:hypothetical protein
MEVSITRGGGLAGVATKTRVSSDALPPERADELREHVERASVFDLPERVEGAGRMADAMSYKLTVEHDGREHTVRLSEDAVPDGVRDLVAFVDSAPEREEQVLTPGS